MKPKQLLGLFLLASPFVGIGIFSLFLLGLLQTIAVFGLTLLIVLVVCTGVHLITEKTE